MDWETIFQFLHQVFFYLFVFWLCGRLNDFQLVRTLNYVAGRLLVGLHVSFHLFYDSRLLDLLVPWVTCTLGDNFWLILYCCLICTLLYLILTSQVPLSRWLQHVDARHCNDILFFSAKTTFLRRNKGCYTLVLDKYVDLSMKLYVIIACSRVTTNHTCAPIVPVLV